MTLRCISYGGGVQSTALIVLATQGALDDIIGGPVDVALFANVGDDSEHPATNAYVRDVMIPWAADRGLEVVELSPVRRGEPATVWSEIMRDDSARDIIPVYGHTGRPLSRTCTADFKIKTLGRELKARGATKDEPATVCIGISTDEIQRAGRGKDEPWERRAYPLLNLGYSRSDCINIIAKSGLPVPPKSSCFFCPYHRPTVWAEMRRDEPELFERAAQLEDHMNARNADRGRQPVYLTRFLKPLREAVTEAQTSLFAHDGPGEDGCDSGYCWT
jgi:hypothetical protein